MAFIGPPITTEEKDVRVVWRCRHFTRRARVEGSGLFRCAELCTVTRNLFIQSENVFSALDVTKVERTKAGKTNCYR